jgi:hypothetical protein
MEENQIKEIKPFRQVPYCEPDTILSITGEELESIQNILNIFQTPLNAVQTIFDRNINQGNITIKYIQQDGTEITKEEAEKYVIQAKNFLKSKKETPN